MAKYDKLFNITPARSNNNLYNKVMEKADQKAHKRGSNGMYGLSAVLAAFVLIAGIGAYGLHQDWFGLAPYETTNAPETSESPPVNTVPVTPDVPKLNNIPVDVIEGFDGLVHTWLFDCGSLLVWELGTIYQYVGYEKNYSNSISILDPQSEEQSALWNTVLNSSIGEGFTLPERNAITNDDEAYMKYRGGLDLYHAYIHRYDNGIMLEFKNAGRFEVWDANLNLVASGDLPEDRSYLPMAISTDGTRLLYHRQAIIEGFLYNNLYSNNLQMTDEVLVWEDWGNGSDNFKANAIGGIAAILEIHAFDGNTILFGGVAVSENPASGNFSTQVQHGRLASGVYRTTTAPTPNNTLWNVTKTTASARFMLELDGQGYGWGNLSGTISYWDVTDGTKKSFVMDTIEGSKYGSSPVLSQNGKYIAGLDTIENEDGILFIVRVYDVASGELLLRTEHPNIGNGFGSMAFCELKELFLLSTSNSIEVYSLNADL
jgi:hypothetical protein